MIYNIDLTANFEDFQPSLDEFTPKVTKAFHHFLEIREKGDLPLLDLPFKTDFIRALDPVSRYFRKSFKTILVFGTGGSSLGGQAITALTTLRSARAPEIIFIDNIDPYTFEQLWNKINFMRTGFIIISKSGNTAETICQSYEALETWKEKTEGASAQDNFLVISENKPSLLINLANAHKIPVLEHPPEIGGRFAALTVVGLLPGMIMGINPYKILHGAQWVLDNPQSALLGAASCLSMQFTAQKKNFVLMPYIDRLAAFARWYRQLWAESLGKQGKGTTPIVAMGTVDQHSQLQLYLDGPKDKFFTLIKTGQEGKGRLLQAGYTMGDLLGAEFKATVETLKRNQCPVRTIHLKKVSEESLGALMMHFILETLIVAKINNINPFTQPAVEEGKELARQYLKSKSSQKSKKRKIA